MQRLHGWLDQLTLRRTRRREAKSDASRRGASVAANCRLAEERRLKPVPIPTITPKPRQGIRTNPWLYTSYPPSTAHFPRLEDPPVASLDRRRPPTLGVSSRLDESTCSSGYGSQDCSPDSSVHQPPWQTATWSHQRKPQPRESWNDEYGSFMDENDSCYDNICDEHIYHELEAICRMPERSYSSDCISCESPQPRADSPIYAQPWTDHWTRGTAEVRQPLVVRNQSFQAPSPRRLLPRCPPSPIYATPFSRPEPALVYPGSFVSRCEKRQQPQPSSTWRPPIPETFEAAEEEFLTELDAQINELQQRSDELRQIVERARQRRQTTWTRPTLECTFELDL